MTVLTHFSPIQYHATLPEQIDVVIIGAGIIGISTAWFLNKAGIKVLVCEKGRVAGEQSSRNWGWVRQQGRDEAELPIMMESIAIWQELVREIGAETGFHQGGSLYLCENQEQLDSYQDFLQIAENHKLDTRILASNELYRLVQNTPELWKSAVYTPSDARAEPEASVTALAKACQAAGVTIIENCGVNNLDFSNGQLDGVNTEQGFVRCNRVLCSAGHWSARLLDRHKLELPQLSVKASVARTAEAPLLFDGNAAGSQIAFRRRIDGGYSVAMTDYLEVMPSLHAVKHFRRFLPLLKLAWPKLNLRIYDETAHVNPFSDEADYTRLASNRVLNPEPSNEAMKRLRRILNERLPILQSVPIVETWSGMIDAMPDAVPVMDEIQQAGGLFVATGFSGHGFGIGPACGKIMSNLIQGQAAGFDIERFRFSRFTDGSELKLGPSI
ncbi:MAG: FAD-binding oxidoreductase [Gammaproteobacteria bacterium]|nr:FAD-binding oxidoreductase [Gammaproteobacteria bacterium]